MGPTGSSVGRCTVTALSGRPTAAELVAAVADFLDNDVRAACGGQVGFHARVAANVLRIVERELLDDTGRRSPRRSTASASPTRPAVRAIRDGSWTTAGRRDDVPAGAGTPSADGRPSGL